MTAETDNTGAALALGVDAGSHGIRLSLDGLLVSEPFAGPPPPARRPVEALDAAFDRALERLPAERLARVGAVAITGVRGSFAALDAAGAPVTPLIPDFDPDCLGQARTLKARYGARLEVETGCPPFPLSGLPKVLALRDAGLSFAGILSPQDRIAERLTGQRALSAGVALRLGVLTARGDALNHALLEELGLSPGLFGPLVPVGQVMGRARHFALPEGALVIAAPGDGPAAHAALGPGAERTALVSMGTTTVTLLPATEAATGAEGVTHEIGAAGLRLFEYGTGAGGVAFDWLARLTGQLPEALELLSRGADPAGITVDPAFLNAWGSAPGATLAGLRPEHGSAEIAAAVLDELGRDAAHALDRLTSLAGQGPDRIVATGGISRSARAVARLSELSGLEVEVRDHEGMAARGAEAVARAALRDAAPDKTT